VIGHLELVQSRSQPKNIKKWKTECMLMTIEDLIERQYGTGMSFPGRRGRFTVTCIEKG
jgi:hypothetical protein